MFQWLIYYCFYQALLSEYLDLLFVTPTYMVFDKFSAYFTFTLFFSCFACHVKTQKHTPTYPLFSSVCLSEF